MVYLCIDRIHSFMHDFFSACFHPDFSLVVKDEEDAEERDLRVKVAPQVMEEIINPSRIKALSLL